MAFGASELLLVREQPGPARDIALVRQGILAIGLQTRSRRSRRRALSQDGERGIPEDGQEQGQNEQMAMGGFQWKDQGEDFFWDGSRKEYFMTGR